jgi:hypothetical protein
MPQGPLKGVVAKVGWKWVPLPIDPVSGALITIGASGGLGGGGLATNTALNIIAPAVLKSGASRLITVSCIAPGSGGTLDIHDSPSVAGCNPQNQIWISPDTVLAGYYAILDLPVSTGLTVGATPTDCLYAVSFGAAMVGGDTNGGIYYQPDPPLGAPEGSLWCDTAGGLYVMGDEGNWEGLGYGW